jgi:hypothetical protein
VDTLQKYGVSHVATGNAIDTELCESCAEQKRLDFVIRISSPIIKGRLMNLTLRIVGFFGSPRYEKYAKALEMYRAQRQLLPRRKLKELLVRVVR